MHAAEILIVIAMNKEENKTFEPVTTRPRCFGNRQHVDIA